MADDILPGFEAGRRTERTEWGLRSTADTFLHRRGDVIPRFSEENARECAGRPELGWRSCTEVVRRTIVTYTTAWELVAPVGKPGGKDGTDGG